MTFGISEKNIIVTGERGDMTLGEGKEDDYVSLCYNQPIPNFIEDGTDSIHIYKEAENRYVVEFWGFMSWSCIVTSALHVVVLTLVPRERLREAVY